MMPNFPERSDTIPTPNRRFKLFSNVPILQSIISGASVALIGELVASALQLLVTTQITRAMGPERYGEYGSVLAALSIIGFLLGFGLDTWLLREGGRDPAQLSRLTRTVLIIKTLGMLTLIVGLIVAGRITALNTGIVLGSFAILADSLTNTGYTALRTLRRNTWIALARVLQPLILLFALYVARGNDVTPLWWIGVSAATSWVLTFVVFMRLRDVFTRVQGSTSLYTVFLGAWAFVVADLLANVYTQSTVLLLGTYAGNTPAGLFKAAFNAVLALQLLPNVVFSVALPMLSNRSVSTADYQVAVKRLAWGAFAYGIAATLAATVGAPYLIRMLSGTKFIDAVPLLQLMGIAPALKAASIVSVSVMLSRQRQRSRIVVQAAVATLNVIAGFLIIPRFGAAGAAAIVVITECALLAGYFTVARRALRDNSAP